MAVIQARIVLFTAVAVFTERVDSFARPRIKTRPIVADVREGKIKKFRRTG